MRRLIQTISFKNFASMQYEAEKGSLLIDVFIDEIIKFSNSEENPETVYRVLNYTRFHLCSLSEESHKTKEFEKNIAELLCVIDTELFLQCNMTVLILAVTDSSSLMSSGYISCVRRR